jgi:signal transduction histidine kinase
MIFNFIKYFILHLKKESVRQKIATTDFRKLLLLTQIILIAIIGILISILFEFLLQNKIGLYTDSGLFLGFLLILILIYNGQFILSKVLVILLANCLFSLNGLREGPDAGNQFLFFPYICALFIIFYDKEFNFLILGLILGIINFCVLEYFSYSLWEDPTFLEKNIRYNYIICITLSAALMVIMLYYLISVNKKYETKLSRVNNKLIQQNRILKKTNTELDSFVYKTSHDLRSPLTSIMGLLNLLNKEKSSEDASRYVKLIEKSILKLDSYILDVLNISRNSRSEVIYKKIDLHKILTEVFEQHSYAEHYSSIERRITVIQNHDLYSDPMRLNMILNNLISNAYRYSNTSKEHSYIHVYSTINKDIVTLIVSDNGIGIEAKHLSNIFNMFYRATDMNNGSGLGLYIVKESVEKLNGQIAVKSVPREDTQITISIPNHKQKN